MIKLSILSSLHSDEAFAKAVFSPVQYDSGMNGGVFGHLDIPLYLFTSHTSRQFVCMDFGTECDEAHWRYYELGPSSRLRTKCGVGWEWK